MPGLTFNNKEIKKILFNGTELSAAYFNGVKFWPAVYEPVTYEVIIKSSQNINLRTLFNSAYPRAQLHENVTVRFKQQNSSIVSSNNTAMPALVTGTWENDVKLEYEMGAGSYIVGRGGNGGGGSYTRTLKSLPFPYFTPFWAANKGSVKAGGNGGTAIQLTHPIKFIGNGIIGGGGGGSGSFSYNLYETIGYVAYNNYVTVGGDGGCGYGQGGIVTGPDVDYGGGRNGRAQGLVLDESYLYAGELGEDARIPTGRDISYGTPGKGGSAVVGKQHFTSTTNIIIKGKVL